LSNGKYLLAFSVEFPKNETLQYENINSLINDFQENIDVLMQTLNKKDYE